ncbi:hypothetical protein [Flammeovirga aprica]|uniref:DUF4268 domain-containing protein n=1 Tax=Flammeovirga aprica JL-4 TaxID=694437 RepID=A0A7X9XDD3_9BACT|nr:hypothetical protein [Flammeovirga aprica]NME72685.1 hypothetical protein [Flammeovirga aprica JL-4]
MKLTDFFSRLINGKSVVNDQRSFDEDCITLKIVSDLKQIPILAKYQWRESRNCFEYKTEYGFNRIAIETSISFDLERGTSCVSIRPSMYLRHNILHDWFSEFSFKSKSDQKESWSVGRSLEMVGLQDEVNFLSGYKNYDQDFQKLYEGIEKLISVIEPYSDIKYLGSLGK